MKKRITEFVVILTLICVVYACIQHKVPETNNKQDSTADTKTDDTAIVAGPDKLIVPGVNIGNISIGGSADSVTSSLGKPDLSDAGMGSVLMTWYDKHDTTGYKTSIFAKHNFGSKDEKAAIIRKILTTSPAFKTEEGLGTGMLFSDYSKYFKLSQSGSYLANGKDIKVYEAKGKGIAFEIDSASNKGVAILVHKPNDTSATYISMH